MSDSSTDTDTHDGEGTFSESCDNPQLDPQAVINLAKSIANCSLVTPPKDERLLASLARQHHRQSTATKSESNSSSSYFSSIRSRLQQTLSVEDGDSSENNHAAAAENAAPPRPDDVLSFLVSDAYSIERLAAEAKGKHTRTSDLEGAGVARIDVYCRSGTVCTCRAVRTAAASSQQQQQQPPEKETRDLREGLQVRRVIRRNCTLQGLKRILEEPPKLPDIGAALLAHGTSDSSTGAGGASRVQRKISRLTREQNSFLQSQRQKYKQRLRRDERRREHVGEAILAAGMGGPSSEMGVDLLVRSTSLDSVTVATRETQGAKSSAEEGSAAHDAKSAGAAGSATGSVYHTQKALQEGIDAADMGLAILMGEAQVNIHVCNYARS